MSGLMFCWKSLQILADLDRQLDFSGVPNSAKMLPALPSFLVLLGPAEANIPGKY